MSLSMAVGKFWSTTQRGKTEKIWIFGMGLNKELENGNKKHEVNREWEKKDKKKNSESGTDMSKKNNIKGAWKPEK